MKRGWHEINKKNERAMLVVNMRARV